MIVSFGCTHRAIRHRASADFDRGGAVIARRALRDEAISTGSSAQRPEIASLSLAMTAGVSGATWSESALEQALEKIAPPGYRRGLSSGGIALLTRRELCWDYGAGSALTPINFVTNFMGPPQFGCPLW